MTVVSGDGDVRRGEAAALHGDGREADACVGHLPRARVRTAADGCYGVLG